MGEGTEAGLYAVARAIDALAEAINRLGNNDAFTRMGALEAHGKAILDASQNIADAIRKD